MVSRATRSQIVEWVQEELKASENSTRSIQLDWLGWMIV